MSSPLGAPHPPQAPLWPASSGLWALGRSHQTHGLTEDVERPLGSFTLTSQTTRDLQRFRRFLVIVILQNGFLSQKNLRISAVSSTKNNQKKSLPAIIFPTTFQRGYVSYENFKGTRIKNRTWTLKHNQIKRSHLLGEKRELKGAAMWHAIEESHHESIPNLSTKTTAESPWKSRT